MTGGLKVYYIPWKPFLMQNTLPTFYGTLPIMRTILIREKISLVHGHQAFSTLCHEALMHARTMGYKVVFTDHSLYGFADVGSIHMNKVLQFTLADVSQAICVSHTSKENTVLRSGLPPEKVFVIPNAVDTAMFTPAPEKLSHNEIVIIVISRLVYRKGADLLVEVIPEICRLFSNVSCLGHGSTLLILMHTQYSLLNLSFLVSLFLWIRDLLLFIFISFLVYGNLIPSYHHLNPLMYMYLVSSPSKKWVASNALSHHHLKWWIIVPLQQLRKITSIAFKR